MIDGIEKHFVDVLIQRSTQGVDNWNNPVQVWADHLTIKGRMRQLNAREQFVSKKDSYFASYRLYCRPVDIQKNDRIVSSGKTYEVKGINDVMEMGILMQVECELV